MSLRLTWVMAWISLTIRWVSEALISGIWAWSMAIFRSFVLGSMTVVGKNVTRPPWRMDSHAIDPTNNAMSSCSSVTCMGRRMVMSRPSGICWTAAGGVSGGVVGSWGGVAGDDSVMARSFFYRGGGCGGWG